MNNLIIDRNKIIRLLIASMVFINSLQIFLMDPRNAQEMIFNMSIMGLILLLVDNIWVALFGAWSLVLFGLYGFKFGQVYLSNILAGIFLYYMTKLSFKKEHIKFYVKIFLWFVVVNLLYCIPQVLGKDFIFVNPTIVNNVTCVVQNFHPGGFMLNEDWMGMLIVFAIPLLIARTNIWFGLIMFIPLFIAKSSLNIFAAVCVYMFCAFFRMSKRLFIILMILGIIMGVLFYIFVDKPDLTRFDVWGKTVAYAMNHFFIGWGLDSFRDGRLPHKDFIFAMDTSDSRSMAVWDNPHNLYISILFEFGMIGLLILGGYLRQLAIWFRKAIKDPYTIGLAGFVLAVLIVSMGHFPMFLARFVVFIIPLFAMFEIILTQEE